MHSVSPFPHTFLSFLFQIKLVSLFPSSSVSERNKARVLVPLTFFHNDDKACAPVLASGSPVVFCSRSHYELIIRIIGQGLEYSTSPRSGPAKLRAMCHCERGSFRSIGRDLPVTLRPLIKYKSWRILNSN